MLHAQGISLTGLEAALALTTRFDRYPPGLIELGEAYERVDRADEARAAYRRALRLAPGDPEAAAGLARLESAVEPAPSND